MYPCFIKVLIYVFFFYLKKKTYWHIYTENNVTSWRMFNIYSRIFYPEYYIIYDGDMKIYCLIGIIQVCHTVHKISFYSKWLPFTSYDDRWVIQDQTCIQDHRSTYANLHVNETHFRWPAGFSWLISSGRRVDWQGLVSVRQHERCITTLLENGRGRGSTHNTEWLACNVGL